MTMSRDPGHRAERDPLLNRADVAKALKRAGVRPEDIGPMLDGLKFPDRASHLAECLEGVGITAERLMDRMGAGP
jgi:hypothetical protein